MNAALFELARRRGKPYTRIGNLTWPGASQSAPRGQTSLLRTTLTEATHAMNAASLSHGVDRRKFLAASAATGAGLALGAAAARQSWGAPAPEPLFKISLAEWSMHGALNDKKLDNLDFPAFAKNECGIDAVEYVNQWNFKDKARDEKYLAELKKRCSDLGVTSVLIMCDGEGQLGDADDAKRTEAVENHYKWVEAAKFLGCHSIRVNAASRGDREEQAKLAADGLHRLAEYGAKFDINVIVENHGGLSSDGAWLAQVIKAVNLPNCGTLPDFGNFRITDKDVYDRYKGVAELMPFAKGVSAKSYAFDAEGNETTMDYRKLIKTVLDAGYHGYIGVEWEGAKPSEKEGVLLTKKLLETIRDEMTAAG
jgi:L-ribulose-5-phosphate 3-epimerase